MWILVIAVLLIGLKLGAIGPFAGLSWWWICGALAAVFIYWEILDPMFAISQKRAMRAMDDKRDERARKAREKLGIDRRAGR